MSIDIEMHILLRKFKFFKLQVITLNVQISKTLDRLFMAK